MSVIFFMHHKRTRPDSMTLTVPHEGNKPYIWFDINCDPFFEVFKMEGVSPENPDDDIIYFEINSLNFTTALIQVKRSPESVEIKLGKEKDSFPFFLISMMIDQRIEVKNQVPLIIVPRIAWKVFDPPYEKFEFDLAGTCPRFIVFKKYIDTFKHSKTVKLVMFVEDDQIMLESRGDSTRFFTIFKSIKIKQLSRENVRKATIFFEQKKLSQWLHSILFPGSFRLLMKVMNNKLLMLTFRVRDEIIASFILPADFDSDRENNEDES